MFSQKIQGFLYGVLITTSLVSIVTYASTHSDGVFGEYFERMTGICDSGKLITGFDSGSTNYGLKECTSLQDILAQAFGYTVGNNGEAMLGFNFDGSPIFGDVIWHDDGTNISYTGAGNVGINTLTAPDFKLEVNNGNIEIQNDDIDSQLRFHDPWDMWYSMGIDNDDGRKFKINHGEFVGSNNDFVINTSGDIGIGTSTPTSKLEVNGNIIADDPTLANHVATKAYVDSKIPPPVSTNNITCTLGNAGEITCIGPSFCRRSTDGGTLWKICFLPAFFGNDVKCISGAGGEITCIGPSFCRRSTDGGTLWKICFSPY